MYWKCTVCGYIHKEAAPPDKCPVCGADKSRFIPVDADGNEIHQAGETPSAEITPPAASFEKSQTSRGPWTCGVCGYQHSGDEPPENCPVCGADKRRFAGNSVSTDSMDHKTGQDKEDVSAPTGRPAVGVSGSQRRWKCSVCGYIHTGAEPPDKCPVCGADRSKFIELPTETTSTAEAFTTPEEAMSPSQTPGRHLFETATDLMVQLHAHPISVHIPNGVAPVAMVFLLFAVLFDAASLETAAAWNIVVVFLAMPFVIFSGINDWKKRFGGHMTSLFLTKLICAAIVTATALILVIWRMVDPSVATIAGGARIFYLLLHGILIAAAAVAGYMGGKLVFPAR